MKRLLVTVVLLAGLLPFLCISLSAAKSDAVESLHDDAQALFEEIPSELRKGIDPASLQENGGVFSSFLQMSRNIIATEKELLSAPFRLFTRIMGAALLYAAFDFSKGTGDVSRPLSFALNAAVCLTVGVAISGTVMSLLSEADAAVDLTARAVECIVPVYSGIIVATGNLTAAALYGFATTAAASAASSFLLHAVHPLAGVLMGLALVSAICDNGLYSIAEGIRKLVVRVLGILSTGFVSLLSLQTSLSGSADTLMLRAARFVASGSVPIIGRAVSDAAATLASSIQVVKGTLGVAGILLIASMLLPRILSGLLCSLSLGLCGVFCDVLAIPALSRSVRTIRSAVDIVIATLTFFGLVLVICTAIMLRTGGV